MAIELGPERMVAGTKLWGIGERLPIDLPAPVASSFGEVADFTDQLPLLAIGGFGQGSDVMVPLHMAMVASTIANGGRMMEPHVVDVTRFHDGTVLERTEPKVWKTPISPTTAATLNTLMVGVVNQGTARQMQLANGIQGAAKTGTAQLNATGEPQRSHAWIIGFAPAESPRYAIAVVLKGTNDEIAPAPAASSPDRSRSRCSTTSSPPKRAVPEPSRRRRRPHHQLPQTRARRRDHRELDILAPPHRAPACTRPYALAK
jgi:penicillin-binding protein A